MSQDKKNDSMSHLLGSCANSTANSVSKLKQDKVAPYRPKVPAIPQQRIADDKRVMEELLSASDEESSYESGDELKYLREGYPPRILKRLRRGDFAVQDELDLHGMIAIEAKTAIHEFINECALVNVSAIRVIHGKGNHSRHKKPVLKNLIIGWLKKNQFVIAATSTPKNDGSTGAVYILLRRKK